MASKIAELKPDHQYTSYYQAISQQLNGDFQNAIVNHRKALVRNSRRTFSELELDLEPGGNGLEMNYSIWDKATTQESNPLAAYITAIGVSNLIATDEAPEQGP